MKKRFKKEIEEKIHKLMKELRNMGISASLSDVFLDSESIRYHGSSMPGIIQIAKANIEIVIPSDLIEVNMMETTYTLDEFEIEEYNNLKNHFNDEVLKKSKIEIQFKIILLIIFSFLFGCLFMSILYNYYI